MAERGWLATIFAGLCAGLLPGCLHGPSDRPFSSAGKDATSVVATRTNEGPAGGVVRLVQLPADGSPPIFAPPLSPYNAWPDHYLPLALQSRWAAGLKSQHEAGEELEQDNDLRDFSLLTPLPDLPPSPMVIEVGAQPIREKKEPLLEALECFLKNKPDMALDLLRTYQPSSQEVYITLLPVLAQLAHQGLDQLSPQEISAIHEQLHGLSLSLRPRAELFIDKMCFCEEIKGYGVYKALPADHSFRSRSGALQGELVRLYVELRNFSLEPCAEGYVTRLSSSVEIRDQAKKVQWFHSFKDQEGPLYRQTPWSDCFGNYRFYMPHLPSGIYYLTITIKDLTRPGPAREKSKTVEMHVGM
jgi:hypothetical protein